MKHFKNLLRSLSSQRNIMRIYVAAMIIPNIFLCITEPYSLSTMVANLLLPGGFFLLWSLATPRAGAMILLSLPFMIFGAFQLVLLYLFGNSIIAVDMYTNLLTTTVSEASELLANLTPAIIGVCVLYLPLLALGVYSMRLSQKLPNILRGRYAVIALVMMLSGLGFAGISKVRNSEFAIKYHIFPINVIHNIDLSVQRWHRSLAYPTTSEGFIYNAKKQSDSSRREIYVLVVGEASRAASWSLFGYERQTNPRLSAMSDIVAFSDVITQSNTTHKSVPIILSSASAENFDSIYIQKSVLALFKEAGFRTLFLSNQTPNRSLVEFFAAQADSAIYLNPTPNSMSQQLHYDTELLPMLSDAIRQSNDNLFVVLHTYGSHFDFSKRYPPRDAYFLPDYIESVTKRHRANIINAYDNSVRETDRFLSELIAILDSTQSCTAMLYCSDHGEEILDDKRNRFLHASPTTTYYQLHVASLAWFSDNYTNLFPQKYAAAALNEARPSSTADVFHTIADIAGIRSQYVDPMRSLVSGSFKEAVRYYLNDYDDAVNFLNTGLTKGDIEMLERHQIRHDKQAIRRKKF